MVYHHAESHPQARDGSFAKSDLVSCGWTPPFFCNSISPCFEIFLLADFSTFSNLPTAVAHYLPSIQLILYQPSLVASKTPSNAPEPLFTSDFHRRCHQTSLSPNPDIWRRNLGIPGTPHLHLFHQQPVNMATTGLCRILLVNGMQIWYAQCDGLAHSNESIAFLSFLWAYCHNIAAAAIYVLMVNAKS